MISIPTKESIQTINAEQVSIEIKEKPKSMFEILREMNGAGRSTHLRGISQLNG